uniref:Uncharacterized protein n=1 Tax=Pelusios castaneus TaxID=367368 RepID=A0A8C8RKI0_9SAUR
PHHKPQSHLWALLCLELLEKMSRNFPSQCENERTAFKSTQDIVQFSFSQKENAKVTIQEILQEIFTIFSKNLTQTSWDGSLIVRFQNGLYQQIHRLEEYVQMEKELTSLESEDLHLTNWTVKKYFQGIDAFLKEKQYSQCAWKVIHMEMQRCFLLIEELRKRLKN